MLTQLEKDKTDFQIELDVVRSQRERNKTELSTIKKELDKKNRVITEKEFEIRDLKERRISRDTPENEVCVDIFIMVLRKDNCPMGF